MEAIFDLTVFTKTRRRILRHKIGRTLFEEVAYEADRRGLMSLVGPAGIEPATNRL